jgi:hypothetical protein
MTDEIVQPVTPTGTATPAAAASPAADEVTSGAPSQAGTSADAPNGERPRAQERIEELAAQNKALREYGEFFRQRFEESQKQPASTVAAPAPEIPAPEPNADDFDDPKAYTKAYSTWMRNESAKEIQRAVKQATEEGKTAGEKAYARAQEETRLRALNDQFAVRNHQYAEKNPGYLDRITNPAMTFMNGEFLETLKSLEKGPDIADHIAKNPQLVARLVSKSVPQRLTELGRIEAELSRPAPPPKVTAAPAPPTPIGSGNAGGDVDPSKLSIDDWMSYRAKQLREKRQSR